ncbi:uncharacterized protein BX664DRAFT_362479 [Halteromyces radiatus]|uniref:uncharacterized protein n=1 Tax=Halteromyces radiatus TaxID=101107 RepID=UPI00221F3082|nr:uncharacterized protein BX664DRAFT_362479 [Halteromyces radiatus]KAI8077686.1 hypothetical protein BX664DRAFT_362479 [Halteromyces radiatus]
MTTSLSNVNSSSCSTIKTEKQHTLNKNNAIDLHNTSSGDYHIRVLGIDEQGAKSRVETQIRLYLELTNGQGEKVQQWSHLRLPEPLLTLKRRATNKRKSNEDLDDENHVIPEEAILHLRASVICESDIHRKVKMCQRCVWREWKRADRKKAGRKLGTTSVYDEGLMERERQRILLFNSDPLLDFNAGECVLPTRITCYSRHHDERQGFRIKFTMHNHLGQLVGSGQSPPIMITDDHKNLSKLGDNKRRRRRRRKSVLEVNESLPTPEEDVLATFDDSHILNTTEPMAIKKEEDVFDLATFDDHSLTAMSSSLQSDESLLDPCLLFPTTPPPPMQDLQMFLPSLWPSPTSSPPTSSTEIGSPLSSSSPSSPLTTTSSSAITSPGLYQQQFHQQQQLKDQLSHQPIYPSSSFSMLPPPMMAPKMERMIPDHASIEGGMEITILGSHFHEGLTCYFGDQPALTSYWSPTTLVCTVPSTSRLGPVLVSLENPLMTSLSMTPLVFTYDSPQQNNHSSKWDEQVIQTITWQALNLNMAQNIHDARQIALRLIHLE